MAGGSDESLYLGVDIGGTKVLAALVDEAGKVLVREKCPTPRGVEASAVIDAIEAAIRSAVDSSGQSMDDVRALGVAVPGVVDPKKGRVVVAPNMNFDNVDLGRELRKRLDRKVAIGNDCNLGALGESWLGAGRDAKSVFAMLWGTGIGGGFVRKGKLWRGARDSAAEVGHIVMQIGGPECGCGNLGCFEALASRTAIERDIRQAVQSGRPSMITELAEGNLGVIRSGMLRKALEAGDEVVTEIMHRAAEAVGHACVTVRHLIDPAVVILGGGVIEACGQHLMPTIHRVVDADRLPGARPGGDVLISALGDDAVVLGAVALARHRIGRSPFRKKYQLEHTYRNVAHPDFGKVSVGKKSYDCDIYIRACGKVKRRNKDAVRETTGSSHVIGRDELKKVCRGGPELLIIGAGDQAQAELNDDGREFLARRNIRYEMLPSPKAVKLYNDSTCRRALLLHATC